MPNGVTSYCVYLYCNVKCIPAIFNYYLFSSKFIFKTYFTFQKGYKNIWKNVTNCQPPTKRQTKSLKSSFLQADQQLIKLVWVHLRNDVIFMNIIPKIYPLFLFIRSIFIHCLWYEWMSIKHQSFLLHFHQQIYWKSAPHLPALLNTAEYLVTACLSLKSQIICLQKQMSHS